MSDNKSFTWASLDNKQLNISTEGQYVTIGEIGNSGAHINPVELMDASDITSIEENKIWDVNKDVYDSIFAWLYTFGSSNNRQGTMKGARIDSRYFKDGIITHIGFLYERVSNKRDINTDNFHLALYDGTNYTYFCDLVQTEHVELSAADLKNGYMTEREYNELTTYYASLEPEPKVYGTDVIVKKIKFELSTQLELDKDFLDNPHSALFIYKGTDIAEVFTHKEIETLSGLNGFAMGCMLRGTNDTMSFSIDSGSAPIYVPFIEYVIKTNTIKDHTDTGFDKYHLSTDAVKAADRLSYSCPYIMGINKINASNVCFNTIHISDGTLMGNMLNDSKRPSKFNLTNKNITKIAVPINPNRPWITQGQRYYFRNGLAKAEWPDARITTDYGIIYLPLRLELYFENPDEVADAVCHTSTNIVVQSPPMDMVDLRKYQDIETLCEFSFDNAKYPGNGIWLKVYNELQNIYPTVGDASIDNLPHDSISEMGITVYQAATSTNDYIITKAPARITTEGANKNNVEFSGTDVVYEELTLNLTAPVKVYFDFESREKWYDFVDEHIHENVLYQYETVNMAEKYGTTTATQYNTMSSFDISGDMIIREDNDDTYYLTAVTFLDTQKASVSDNVGYYLKIQDGDNSYISQNAVYINWQMWNYIPTWLFAASDKIKLSSSTITVGLTTSADKDAPFDSIWTKEDTNGIALKFYSSNTAGCTARRQNATSGTPVETIPTGTLGANYVPAVLFSFKYSKIDDLTSEIEKLKTDLITLQTSVASLTNYISN